MNHHPSDDDKSYPKHHFQFGRDFVFHKKRRIYEPKAAESYAECPYCSKNINAVPPFVIEIKRDKFAFVFTFLACLISLATLYVVARYTNYAGGQLTEMKRTNGIASNSAEAAMIAANYAGQQIDFSRDALHAAERPWVLQTAKNIPPLAPNVKFDAYVQILNTGKAPALDTRVKVQIRYFKKFPLPNPPYDETPGGQSHVVLAPNVPIPTKLSDVLLFDEPFNKIQRGDVTYYIYGEIRYTDAFMPKHEHVTHFCTQYHPEDLRKTLWAGCEFYDDAN